MESKVFKNYVMFAHEYEPEKLKDELGDDFQGCLLPDSSIEFILNRYAVSCNGPVTGGLAFCCCQARVFEHGDVVFAVRGMVVCR
jgi:hypothetical protein